MATLQANTGQNDNNSVWGSGLLDTVGAWGNTAGTLYNTFTNNGAAPATPTATASPTPAASSGFSKYLPWVIGGVVLLVVLGIVFKK